MTTLTPQRINDLIEQREALTNRRDEHIDFDAVDAIDAQLATVPAGVNNTLDLLLGRPSAVLPERVEYQTQPNSTQAEIDRQQRIYEQLSAVKEVWSTSEQRAEWKDAGAAQIEQAAQAKQSEHDAYLESISDQYADMLDWHRICGDLAL